MILIIVFVITQSPIELQNYLASVCKTINTKQIKYKLSLLVLNKKKKYSNSARLQGL